MYSVVSSALAGVGVELFSHLVCVGVEYIKLGLTT